MRSKVHQNRLRIVSERARVACAKQAPEKWADGKSVRVRERFRQGGMSVEKADGEVTS